MRTSIISSFLIPEMYSGTRHFTSEEAEIREYGEEYRQYKRRFEKALERWEHPFYDKLWGSLLSHGFSPNYEFTEPFEISPSLKGKLELEENRKYTFWEKMASEPEKQKKILEDTSFEIFFFTPIIKNLF